MGFFRVVAVDLDGTLTSGGQVSAQALEAVDRVRRDGLQVVLVTGRIVTELAANFPQITDHVDALVAENGAVTVTAGRTYPLSAPVDRALGAALDQREVPYRRGEVILAADGDYAATILEAIGALNLDCQIVRDRAALMVVPAGVTKGTGLAAVLTEMNLSPHNTIAIGDAENDLSLFGSAEIGVAAANALSSVRERADLVLEQPDGAGVAELLTGAYLNGARRWCPARRWVQIGTFDDGTPTKVPGSQARMVVTGPAKSGKSYLVGLLAEEWINAGYCVLLVDPEGDHGQLEQLNRVQLINAQNRLPEPVELVCLLQPHTSLVVDLSALSTADKVDYLHRLRPAAEAHREARGFPHWVIYDEAHLLGADRQPHWTRRGGYLLSSFVPSSLPAGEVDDTDIVLTLDAADMANDVTPQPMRRASVQFGSAAPRAFTIAARRTGHVRHSHKYADVSLPKERRFYFRPTDGHTMPAAGTMHEFRAAIGYLDLQALQYHLERGDFSRWLGDTIADMEFAAQVAAWEDELVARRAADLQRVRRQLIHAIEQRYLNSADNN
ncbi:MAG TPA: HAD hydrolase family protein [Mycobacterium sp.]|nr:HAD hydrolase family protein [Mycobacterium sp.]HUH68901.1 HAD hydrolase family protein [Mycobacterium sp.]